MTLAAFKEILDSTGLPVAYGFFPKEEEPELPCITYEVAYTSNFAADRIVYERIRHIDVFLFAKHKDEAAEGLIEQAFEDNNIIWDMTETYLDDQKVYQIIYEVQING